MIKNHFNSNSVRYLLSSGFIILMLGCSQMPPEGVNIKNPQNTTVGHSNNTTQPPTEEVHNESNEIELVVLNYQEIQMLIESYRGKIVVVDYWSTDCPPCLKEFPNLVALDNKYSDEQVLCLSVNLDYLGLKNKGPETYRESVMPYLQKFDAKFMNIISADDTDKMLTTLKLGSPPAVFVYNQQGELAKRFDNTSVRETGKEFTYENVETKVIELLESTSSNSTQAN